MQVPSPQDAGHNEETAEDLEPQGRQGIKDYNKRECEHSEPFTGHGEPSFLPQFHL